MEALPQSSTLSPLLVPLPLPLDTARLHIRAIAEGDGAGKAAAVNESWDGLNEWLNWQDRDGLTDPVFQEKAIGRDIAEMTMRNTIRLIAIEKASGQPAVYCGFHKIYWPARQMELDFWAVQSKQRQGYATEACRAAIDWAFNALQATAINATHTLGNTASQRVIEKLGFSFTHKARYNAPLRDGKLHDNMKYCLLAPAL